ncbi:MAG: DUF4961 domain-containing protein [Muribaculaceae bacterium]|nr:DUF4961 domain-containing protein [Muribaculaceae bacterium]
MKRIYKIIFAVVAVCIAVFASCVYLDSIDVKQPQGDGTMAAKINAGEIATFVMNGHIEVAGDQVQYDDRLIFAILVPKAWKLLENNPQVTYRTTVLETWETVSTMSPIPDTQSPKNMQGYTWPDALMERFGVGTNVLNDMEWVAFKSDKGYHLNNGDKPYFEVTVKCYVGMQNLRARLGFFINRDDDGLSQDDRYFKASFSDPFTVENGTGTYIDFCTYHYNAVEPLESNQNDFITFSFIGSAHLNDLSATGEVYFNAVAHTDAGNTYEVMARDASTLMKRENSYSSTYKKTIWPAGYFGVPEGETITKIEYQFVNADGTIVINKTADDIAGDEPEIIENQMFGFETTNE